MRNRTRVGGVGECSGMLVLDRLVGKREGGVGDRHRDRWNCPALYEHRRRATLLRRFLDGDGDACVLLVLVLVLVFVCLRAALGGGGRGPEAEGQLEGPAARFVRDGAIRRGSVAGDVAVGWGSGGGGGGCRGAGF